MRWPNGTSYSEHKSPPVSGPQNNITCWRKCWMNGCVRMTKVDVLQKTSSELNRSHTIYLVSIVGLDGAAWRPALPSSYGSLNTPSDHGPARSRPSDKESPASECNPPDLWIQYPEVVRVDAWSWVRTCFICANGAVSLWNERLGQYICYYEASSPASPCT